MKDAYCNPDSKVSKHSSKANTGKKVDFWKNI
jgi:hypothetical protein